jgi:hypothetical protein
MVLHSHYVKKQFSSLVLMCQLQVPIIQDCVENSVLPAGHLHDSRYKENLAFCSIQKMFHASSYTGILPFL